MSGEKVGRRDYAKAVVGAVAGLAVGGAAGYLLKPEAPAAPGITETVTVKETITVPATPPPPEYTFYFCGWNPGEDPNGTALMYGCEHAGKHLNVDARFVYPEKFSLETVIDTYDSAIMARPDGIAFACWFPEAFEEPYRKAADLGITVVSFNVDTPLRVQGDENWRGLDIGYVGQDEYSNGRAVGSRCLQEFTPKRLCIGTCNPGAFYSVQRVGGIQDVFKENAPDVPVDVLAVEWGKDPSEYYEDVRAYLEGYPDTDLLIILQPTFIHPTIELLKDRDLVGKVRLGGTDVSSTIMEAIDEGVQICATAQQFFFQSYLSILWLYSYLTYGFLPPDNVETGPAVIDKESLPVIRKQVEVLGAA